MRWLRIAFWMVLVSLTVASADRSPFGSVSSAVLTDTEAFLLLPPELIAAPVVQQMAPSSGGRYLLVARQSLRISLDALRDIAQHPHVSPPPLESSLVLWDSRSRAARTVWRTEENVSIAQMQWLSQSSVALVLLRLTVPPDPAHLEQAGLEQHVLLSIPGSAERAEVVARTEPPYTDTLEIYLSPTRPLAILERTHFFTVKKQEADGSITDHLQSQSLLYTLGADGRIGRAIAPPENIDNALVGWDADGDPILRCLTLAPEGKKLLSSWVTVDAATGQTRPLPKEPSHAAAPPARTSALPLRVKAATAVAQEEETKEAVGLLWLESLVPSRKPRALLTGDGADGRLLPGGEAVVYTSQGAVWAVPLLRMPKDRYDAMEREARKALAIDHAKQVGLALLLYSQDYDETLPGGDDINNTVAPYLKNTDPLDGFNYTYPGGKLADIAKPAETLLGSVAGPGGRAFIYADGHVRWRDD